jgi:hypothetical protein
MNPINNIILSINYIIIVMIKKIIFILLIFGIVYWIFGSGSYDVVEGLDSFNGRMAVDNQYMYDSLFNSTVGYNSDYIGDSEDLLETGWSKCKKECMGHCVEFGLSGFATCFQPLNT